jgi:sugar lactone lactonase YvrE
MHGSLRHRLTATENTHRDARVASGDHPMTRSSVVRRILLAVVAFTVACGYDGTSPYSQTPPPPPDGAPSSTTPRDGLWTASGSDPALLRFGATQLAASGTVAAGTTITTASASLMTLNAIAFDDAGTMWVASQNDSLLLGFAAGRLETTKVAIATHVIAPANGSLAAPTGLAFDRQKRLWVANSTAGTLVRYEPVQLSTGGRQVPSVTLTGIGRPTAVAFDASGALWVSDGNANRIARYGAAKLAASGAPAPDVVISGGASTLQAPAGLAFDTDGRLWVANGERRDVVAFGAAQLAAGGSIAPAIVLVPSNRSVSVPTGLAFDDAGSLWVVSGDGLLARYDRAQLTASGEPNASATLRVDAHVMLWSLAFWPKLRGLPIN